MEKKHYATLENLENMACLRAATHECAHFPWLKEDGSYSLVNKNISVLPETEHSPYTHL